MAFVEDVSVFLADFGQPATLDGAAVTVIFDNPSARASVGMFGSSAVGMATSRPVAMLPTAQVPASPVGLVLVVGERTYTVAAHDADGTGLSELTLEAA